jgi:hypothetical protein
MSRIFISEVSMGFTKLDEGILMSSIMAENPEVFKVWIALLAATKEDGIARVSTIGIASHCFMSIESVKNAIKVLESEDSESRSTNDEGRRIRRVDGGFEIINYLKYRELTYRDREAQRKYEYRKEKSQNVPDSPGHVRTLADDSASASASLGESANPKASPVPKQKRESTTFKPPSLEQVEAYCDERGNKVNASKWYNFYESKGWMIGKNKMKSWKAAVHTWEAKYDEKHSGLGTHLFD